MLYGSHELVSHDNNHTQELQEFYEEHEGFDDSAVRRDYFGRMDENDFVDFTQQVTSVIRTGDSTQRQEYDGDGVALMGIEVPEQRDKTELIKEAWSIARGFLNDPKLEDKAALEYAGLTAAGSVLYAHPNKDGNGRMARTIDHMIEEGTEQPLEEVLPRILGVDGNTDWYVAPDAAAMRQYAQEEVPAVINGYEVPDYLNWDNSGLIEDAYARKDDPVEQLIDGAFGNTSLLIFVTHADERAMDILKKHTVQEIEDNATSSTLNAKAALEELTHLEDGGIGYAAQLVEANREARKEYVRSFMNMMYHTELQEMPDRLKESLESTRDFNVDKATREHFGKLAVGSQIVPADHMRAHHKTYSRIKRERDGFE